VLVEEIGGHPVGGPATRAAVPKLRQPRHNPN
jgi:hypothetical protein